MTDKEILELYRDGQQQRAFNEIVKNYSERLYWHVRSLVCSHEDTDDLLQDIFVKVWTALPSFRGEAQFYTWLYRIATNVALNFLGKQKVRAALSFESLTDSQVKKIEETAQEMRAVSEDKKVQNFADRILADAGTIVNQL